MDEDIKRRFDNFCSKVGLNSSVAVNMFVRAVLYENRIPFDITAPQDDPFYSKTNQARLRKSMEDLDKKENIVIKTMEELEAMAND